MHNGLTSRLCEGTDGINNILKELYASLEEFKKANLNPELQR